MPKLRLETVIECGKGRDIMTACDSRYRIWVDRLSGEYRWALRFWKDDGMMVAGHGKRPTLEAAIDACETNWELRLEIEKESNP